MFGRSGSGKTMSALLLARGLVGPNGRIVLVDSESGRGSLFADIIPGSYKVIDLEPPFSPMRYEEAITTAEGSADCVVVDSLSHEHNGEGGILDMQEAELTRMAGDNWSKREACKMASWIPCKLAHKKFIQRLLRLKCGLICCLRGEEKTHMVKDEHGKNRVVTDQFSSPLFDARFQFELLLCFETIAKLSQKTGQMEGGYIVPRKITHPGLVSILPKENEQIGIAFGEKLAAWCNNTSLTVSPVMAPSSKDDRSRILAEIRDATTAIHHWKRADGAAAWPAAKEVMVRWLTDECGIQTVLDAQTVEELSITLAAAKQKLTNQPAGQLL